MALPSRPKVGLVFFTAEWFEEVGAKKGYYQNLPKLIDEDASRIKEILKGSLNIIPLPIVNSKEKASKVVEILKGERVDLLILCYLTWGEDRLILEIVENLPHVPLLLWCYSPFPRLPNLMDMVDLFRSSGTVGTIQATGPLKRMGKKFGFVIGSYKNEGTIKKIIQYSRAAKLVNDLKKVKVGVLPYRCDQMTGTYVDEFRLRKEIGPELKYISVYEYYTLAKKISKKKVEEYVRKLKENYRILGVTDEALRKGVRASLGLVEVVKKFQLDALALQDLENELHRMMGLRPCLYVPSLFEKAVVSMEADVGGAVGLWILKNLTGKPPMYIEIFTYDEKENAILAGHAGIHDVNLAEKREDVTITPDREYMEAESDTCWMQFRAKGGKVTMLSLFCDVEKFKIVISQGHALSGKEKLDGSPHIYIKLTTPLEDFFRAIANSGMTQHWAIVHDDVVNEVEYLAELLNLEKLSIK